MLPASMCDPNLQIIINQLMADPLAASALPLNKPLSGDGVPIAVNKLVVDTYETLRCHHNCRVHQLRNQGEIIYGWNLYAETSGGVTMYVAQHHAIWKKNGQYLDVTPEYDKRLSQIKTFTFLPDNRVQIGHTIRFYAPPLFFHCQGLFRWATGLEENSRYSQLYFETLVTSSEFAIKALDLLPDRR